MAIFLLGLIWRRLDDRVEGKVTFTVSSFISTATIFVCLTFTPPVDAQRRGPPLSDGDGKQLVQQLCLGCHKASRITWSSGYDRDGWKTLIGTMMDLSSSPLEEEQILQYLARYYPPNRKRSPKLIKGKTKISFREWTTPTLGQRPRDPIEGPDGTIWWAGQWGNVIGRLHPSTGAMKEFPLPANAKPHTVTLDKAGNVWYTGNKNGTVGYLEPSSGKITVFDMPNPAARDPHSAIFDARGILWFTLQRSNMVGRLDPTTGKVDLVKMKTRRSRPYGIKIDGEGNPWVACNGSNCLVRVDPISMDLTEIKLPTPRSTVRRLDFDDDGMLWYVNSSQGRIGRYNPQTNKFKEWPSPSGPKSHPYAIAVIDNVVWYNESRRRPDALVRFDPKSETFQSWPIPSGSIYAGIIRHMRPTRDGNLIIHQSSTNRIIMVKLNGM